MFIIIAFDFNNGQLDICSSLQDFWPQCHLRTMGTGTGWPTLQENSSLGTTHQVTVNVHYFP